MRPREGQVHGRRRGSGARGQRIALRVPGAAPIFPSGRQASTSLSAVLLSDRDLKAALAAGRMGLTPYDEAMVQPSSIDVRLDRYFRVFANHRYTHIDPAVAQDDLTELLEPEGEEPFILHPGEFVLGSTLEVISLGDDLAARLEGKALALDTEVPTPWGWTTM